ncbi:ABC transporter ATP-binding protein [Schaalia canis]|uniref:ABC transporter ATP-binding protein n=1 Tax=Schaalia canis TaxID=100469 RepID=A0A3P1SE84_9ACTO|nr:ABC transporter ATP-binding protein [Schaalia canis]RRC94622.1 ABC transporter ATP-binding protein [Schaalia canis]
MSASDRTSPDHTNSERTTTPQPRNGTRKQRRLARERAQRRREAARSTMSAEVAADLDSQARALDTELSPIAPTPSRWLAPLRSPRGPALVLPATGNGVLRALLRERRWAAVFALSLFLLGSVSSALMPWAMGRALDIGLAHGIGSELAWASVVFVLILTVVAAGDGFGQLAETGMWAGADWGSKRSLASRISQRSRAIKRTTASGDVVTAASTDSGAIGDLFTTVPEFIAATISICIVSYLMLTASVPLGLTVLIGLPIVLAFLAWISRPLEKRQSDLRDEQGKLTTIATDAVQGLRILRGIGGEASYAAAYAEQSQRVRDAAIRAAATSSLLYAARIAAPMLLITLVVAQGALLTLNGQLTVGQLLSFYGFTLYLRHPLWMAAMVLENLTRARVGARRIGEVFAVEPLVADAPSGEGESAGATTTAAPASWERATLSVGTVDLTPGRITALVGPTPEAGAALARNFARVEDPTPLLIDGIPATQIPVDELRKRVILSEATPQLFAGTLREALRGSQAELPTAAGVTETVWRNDLDTAARTEEGAIYDTPSEADPRLLEAMAHAHAEDVLTSLPGGLNGNLAEKGRNISGGQRQRVALARAYSTQAPVLILVEPTSALDAHTEALVGQSLQAARGGRTTLIVTHSPLLLTYCDEVIVIDEAGGERARGTYEELLDASSQASANEAYSLHAILGKADQQ